MPRKKTENRGIGFHYLPMAIDVCTAYINIEVDQGNEAERLDLDADVLVVGFDEVIDELVAMWGRVTGIKNRAAIGAIRERWAGMPRSRILKGAKLYENHSQRVAVPITAIESILLNGGVDLDDDERKRVVRNLIPYRGKRSVGHAFFKCDCGHPVLLRWLSERKEHVLGSTQGLVNQIGYASSHPDVKKLKRTHEAFKERATAALPPPKEE